MRLHCRRLFDAPPLCAKIHFFLEGYISRFSRLLPARSGRDVRLTAAGWLIVGLSGDVPKKKRAVMAGAHHQIHHCDTASQAAKCDGTRVPTRRFVLCVREESCSCHRNPAQPPKSMISGVSGPWKKRKIAGVGMPTGSEKKKEKETRKKRGKKRDSRNTQLAFRVRREKKKTSGSRFPSFRSWQVFLWRRDVRWQRFGCGEREEQVKQGLHTALEMEFDDSNTRPRNKMRGVTETRTSSQSVSQRRHGREIWRVHM
jgi:hypothetical protein